MKKFLVIAVLFLIFIFTVSAQNNALNEIYEQQFKISGADKLAENLPKETVDLMNEIDIPTPRWEVISKLNPEKIISKIFKMFHEKFFLTFSSFLPILSVIILCAVLNNVKDSFKIKNISKLMDSVGAVCVCWAVIDPTIKCINNCVEVIKSASNFTLCVSPIMAGIMVASGNPVSATSYQALIIFAGQLISHLATNFFVPFLNILFSISLISSLLSRIDLQNLCGAAYKCSKFILKFATSFFTGLLAVQNLVSVSADNVGANALKFTIDTCVPIVGGAISDAFTTVKGCINLLKSGVGAFGIIAGALIFLPVIVQCTIWILFLNVSLGVSDIFALKKISVLLKSTNNVISIVFALLLSVLIILIVSTVILLMIGR